MKRISKEFEIEDAIVVLLHERGAGKTICPSEAARKVFENDWREHMADVRTIADKLAAKGIIEVYQKGQHVSSATAAVGAIRLRLT